MLLTLRIGRPAVPQVREARATYPPHRSVAIAPLPAEVMQQVQRARRAEAFVHQGRHAAAERLLRDVHAALVRRRAWPQAIPIAIGLGKLLMDRGRAADAAKVFSETAAAAATAGEEPLEIEARTWLALARTDLGQLTSAEAIRRALLQVTRSSTAHRVWITAVLIRVLLWQDRPDDARVLPLPEADESADVVTGAFINATAVRLLLTTGQLFEAGLRSEACLAIAGNSSLLARSIALSGQLRVRLAAGDLAGAEVTVREIAATAREARLPLRLIVRDCCGPAGLDGPDVVPRRIAAGGR